MTRLLWATTLLGAAGLAAARVVAPQRFWANWILWFLFLSTLALGCLFLVALERLVAARWSVPLRRVPERLGTLLLPLAPVALAALGALPHLYPSPQNGPLDGKAQWLSPQGFTLRTGLCVALGLLSLFVLVRGSLAQDRSRDPRFSARARRFAPVFMALFALTLTVMAFDWVSALTPHWYSDLLGVYAFAGSVGAGVAATTLGVLFLQARRRLPGVGPDHLYNLGGFLFGFTVFWAYIAFSQYLLMWYGNLPEEAGWYAQRLQGGWRAVTVVLAMAHFFLPFFALASRGAKSAPGRLAPVAALLLAAHLLDLYWLVFPALGAGVLCGWPELSAAAFFLSATLLWGRRAFTWGRDLPVGDPYLAQGLEFRL